MKKSWPCPISRWVLPTPKLGAIGVTQESSRHSFTPGHQIRRGCCSPVPLLGRRTARQPVGDPPDLHPVQVDPARLFPRQRTRRRRAQGTRARHLSHDRRDRFGRSERAGGRNRGCERWQRQGQGGRVADRSRPDWRCDDRIVGRGQVVAGRALPNLHGPLYAVRSAAAACRTEPARTALYLLAAEESTADRRGVEAGHEEEGEEEHQRTQEEQERRRELIRLCLPCSVEDGC